MWNIDLSRPVRNGLKCSFIIENTQNSIHPDLQPLLNTRYWTTQTYNSTYFNDFILFALRQDILNGVMINTMSCSAWHFKRFISLAVKILDGEVEAVNWKMDDFINFEADIEGDDEEIGEVNNISDENSVNSFIDNQEVKTDVNFYRHFANVENDIEQILQDAYNKSLEDIEIFDEISNLWESSEDEPETDNFKKFEVNIQKFNESLFPSVAVEHEKVHNQFSNAILYALRFDRTGLKDMCKKEEFEKTIVNSIVEELNEPENLNLLLIYKNFIVSATKSIQFYQNTINFWEFLN